MSDVEALSVEDAVRASDRNAYFEQRIFIVSPFGSFVTAFLLFIVLFGLFVVLAEIEHVTLFTHGPEGFGIENATRMAFTVTLLLCTALFIQRYTRMKERADRPAYAAVLEPGALMRRHLMELTPGDARLVPFTILGFFVGLIGSWFLFGANLLAMAHPPYATLVWFTFVNVALVMSFTRGVELSRAGSRAIANAIENDLVVDLLRIDTLSVWGRAAARFALIWFTVSAVSCLFFIDAGLNGFTLSMLATFLAMGVYVFVRPMEQVHKKIRAAKHAELERIRGQIDGLREAAVNDASAATRLQGLLAYETRIAAAAEWPFDQTTLVRVGASAMILTVPWFGQAIAAYLVDHISRIVN